MVNKPCSQACTRATASRPPPTYRSRSAGSLPQRRYTSEGYDYVEYLFGNNVNEADYIKELQRPAVIQQDLYEMDRRKRVQEVLQHKEFCQELENAIRPNQDVKSQEMVSIAPPSAQATMTGLHNIKNSVQVKPVADLANNSQYNNAERILRNKLACLYRLVDLFQWSQGIYNHITLRLPQRADEPEEILINPFGLLYNEITASSLVKISLEGDIIDGGSTNLGINQAGYVLHSAIHASRPDVKCVLHLHTPIVSAVSSMKCGLLPISQEAMIVGTPAYHDFQGIVCNEQEKESIVQDLGNKNLMILRNHGFVACGQSVEDALHLAFHVIIACETQIRAARIGIENLIVPSKEAVERAYQTARHGGGGVNRTDDQSNQWGIGELEWEAWMRVLDSAGFKTGQIYRKPNLKFRMEQPSFSSVHLTDIATPPSSSSRGCLVETYSDDNMSKCDPLRKQLEKANWLNSPNNYMKINVLDCSSDTPKTVIKWISDLNAPQTGTPIKISSVHQFLSLNSDTKEFRDKQNQLRDMRLSGKTTSGPISQFVDTFYSDDQSSHQNDDSYCTVNVQSPVFRTNNKDGLYQEHQNNGQLYERYHLQNSFLNEKDNNVQAYLKENESQRRSTSAIEQSIISYNVSSPQDSPIRERSKSFEFDAASLMQAVHFNSCSKDSNGDFTDRTIEVPPQRTKRRRGFRTLFSFGRKKK